MRERIVRELRAAAARSEFDRARWTTIRDRLGEIAISTIDAFCLSLLREFPLEADLDPGFDMADETEVPRLVEESLDRSLRIFAGLAKRRAGCRAGARAARRLANARRAGVAAASGGSSPGTRSNRFLARGPAGSDAERRLPARRRRAAGRAARRCRAAWRGSSPTGPSGHPRYQLLVREVCDACRDLDALATPQIRGAARPRRRAFPDAATGSRAKRRRIRPYHTRTRLSDGRRGAGVIATAVFQLAPHGRERRLGVHAAT